MEEEGEGHSNLASNQCTRHKVKILPEMVPRLKLEDVFAAMRETLRGAQECAHALEVKDEDTEDVRLPDCLFMLWGIRKMAARKRFAVAQRFSRPCLVSGV